MLGNHGRSITKAIFTPVARVLVAAHITPNMVTIAGTVVTIAVAVTTFPFGYLWQGALALAVVLFCDSIDGVLARMRGTSSPFGAFLDSAMDMLGDGADCLRNFQYGKLTIEDCIDRCRPYFDRWCRYRVLFASTS